MSRNAAWGLLIAMGGMVLFWLGGFALLANGADWPDIESAIAQNESIIGLCGGKVYKIAPGLIGYQYGFAGESGHASFVAKVDCADGRKEFSVELERTSGPWSLTNLRQR